MSAEFEYRPGRGSASWSDFDFRWHEHDATAQTIRVGDVKAASRLTSEYLTRGRESLIQGLFPHAEPAENADPTGLRSTG